VDVRAVLGDVAGLGPFFAVDTAPVVPGAGWRPMAELYTDPRPLRLRLARTGAALGTDDDRVAASITFQGLAAQLVSAPLAAVVLHGVLPELDARSLLWRPATGGPWPLCCPDPTGAPVDGIDDATAALAGLLVDEHLAPLVTAVRAEVAVSAGVLWGNVGSAVAAAKRLLGMQRPAAAGRAARVAERLLRTGPLAGTGELLAPGEPDRDWSFRRSSCCLYYRVPGGGLCGDCVLS
jgi:hypothetical protein